MLTISGVNTETSATLADEVVAIMQAEGVTDVTKLSAEAKNQVKTIKATIKDLIVALFIIIIVLIAIYLFCGQEIGSAIQLVNQVAIKVENISEQKQTEMNTTTNRLINYPEYGTKYATIEIPKIDVNLPVYFGDTLEILKNGVRHSSGSYFPAEGGSIIYIE